MKHSRLRAYIVLSIVLHILLLWLLRFLPPAAPPVVSPPVAIRFLAPAAPPQSVPAPPVQPPPELERSVPPAPKPPEPPQTTPKPPEPTKPSGVVAEIPKPVQEQRPDQARILSQYDSKAQDIGPGEQQGARRPSGEQPRLLPPEIVLPERYSKLLPTPQTPPTPLPTPPVSEQPQALLPPSALPTPEQQRPLLPSPAPSTPERAKPLPAPPTPPAPERRTRPAPTPVPRASPTPPTPQRQARPAPTPRPQPERTTPERQARLQPETTPQPTPRQQPEAKPPLEPPMAAPGPRQEDPALSLPPKTDEKTAEPRYRISNEQEMAMLQRERPSANGNRTSTLEEHFARLEKHQPLLSFDVPGTYERGPERPGEGKGDKGEGKYQSIDSFGLKHFSYLIGVKRKIELVFSVPFFAANHGTIGVPIVGFTIRRNGELAEAVLLRSSGYAVVDKALLEAIKRAAPYGPFPEHLPDAEISIKVFATIS